MVILEFLMVYNFNIRYIDFKYIWYKYLYVGFLLFVIYFFYKKCWISFKFEMKKNVFDEIKKY